MTKYRIATIPGDGIGKEVVPEGIRVLEAAGRRFGIEFQWDHFPWSCEYYAQTGRMMPEDGLDQIRGHDAVYLGAVGFPGVPDHVSLWGLLIPIRRGFQQYVNLRPVRLMPGVPCPLANKQPGDIDFWVVRENSEGEYSSVGGRSHEGTEQEMAVQQSIFTRRGVDRILRYAFELAMTRQKKHVTSATKSNGIAITMPYWDERFRAISAQYPEVRADQYHVDIRSGSTWWWDRTSSVTSSRTSGREWPVRSASRRRPTSTPSGSTRRASSRCTGRRRTSTAGRSRIPLARSGRAP
jgi:tartrate dehydrogenase/decarboxylase/D-malate dehydrogenase